QRLADPLPATRLVVRRPDQEGPCRVGQFGDDTDQLTVKVHRPTLLMARPVPGDRHSRAVRTGQPDRDVPVVVQAGAGDFPRADDLGTFIVRDPHVGHIHEASFRPLSHTAGYSYCSRVSARCAPAGLPAQFAAEPAPTSSARTSPMVRSRLAGSGSGRCAWTRYRLRRPSFSLTTYPASTRSVIMPKALRSVMSRLAAMSRRRAPGSWATHSRTRAWLVRKLQLATSEAYGFRKIIASYLLQV